MKVGFISLGCSKNLVVTEEMIGLFKKHKYSITPNVEEADIILINTCGFIESSKKESIEKRVKTWYNADRGIAA